MPESKKRTYQNVTETTPPLRLVPQPAVRPAEENGEDAGQPRSSKQSAQKQDVVNRLIDRVRKI